MAFHHVAISTRDLAATHAFYDTGGGQCTSIYAEDPNGITVEFCCTTGVVRDPDAASMLVDPAPPLETPPEPRFSVPEDAATS